MTKDKVLALALEALENSVDLVREDAYNAEKLYGNYPARQGKVRGLKVLADDHEKAITAIKQALAAPVQEPVATVTSESGNPDVTMSWWHEPPLPVGTKLYTTPPAQPAPVQEPVSLHAMAKRRVFDAIRGAYDLGYNDARRARAVHGDSAPGYKGRDVESDHGGALISALERYTAPPAAQPAVPDALTSADIQEHIEYVAGWNDCRQAMLEMMK